MKMVQDKIAVIEEKIKGAELVLVGIGEQFASEEDEEISVKAYRNLGKILKGKNYFIITTCVDGMIYKAGLKETNIVCPMPEEKTEQVETGRDTSAWERYMMWLQGTLNKKLLVLELGVGLVCPGIIRFPFEKVVFYNQKAELIRIHTRLFQLPAELSGRSVSFQENVVRMFAEAEM